MKKSEKVKGKEKVAIRKRQYRTVGIVAGAIVIVAAIILFILFNPFVARAGDQVTVYYTGMLDNGTVFGSNVNGTPIVFNIGEGKVLPGFEAAVVGMGANETKTIHIPAEKAYGLYQPSLIHVVDRSLFPANLSLVPGGTYTSSRASDGATTVFKVINITESSVTVDENHALAGENLTYTIKLVSFTRK
ncbi:MAG: FKBP-type peptidyl-prolyl cis-trans isomerase [Methanoregula sp.]